MAVEEFDHPKLRSQLECLVDIESKESIISKAVYEKFRSKNPRDDKGLNHYLSNLGITATTTYKEAHKKWRNKLESFHPDKEYGSEVSAKDINEAWSLIKNVLRK